MANKPVQKYPINKDIFMKILKDKNISMRELGRLPLFGYSARSIGRALESGFMTGKLRGALASILNVSVNSFSEVNDIPEMTPRDKISIIVPVSQYGKVFDSSSPYWQISRSYNLVFLRATQQYFNDMLKIRGNVFLNEVYDRLGFSRTAVGAVVGWLKDIRFGGEGFINFDINDLEDSENAFVLDFNVDGIIVDKIEVKETYNL